ncbi:MAG: glycosyltransferase family 2 protein [Bacteroidales bacterium]|nr:glycosyltransferase family 2 protein [Bacteroidales bacterium]
MQIAIIIPVYNHLSFTKQALADLSSALKDIQEPLFPVIIIDDGSSDGTGEWININYPDVHLLQGDGNLWWSGAVNMGARYALESLKADFILLWNNDINFDGCYFRNLIRIIKENNNDTIIGSKILVEEQPDIIWSMGGYFNPVSGKHGMVGYFKKNEEVYKKVFEADWLTGMGTIIPGQIIEKLGYWDNINFPQYSGDSDFTYRAKLKGHKIIVHPDLILFNKTEHSGVTRPHSFKQLLNLLTDNRSKSNFKRNLKFYKLYAKSCRAYMHFYWKYCLIFGGFIKWKIFDVFGIRKKRT